MAQDVKCYALELRRLAKPLEHMRQADEMAFAARRRERPAVAMRRFVERVECGLRDRPNLRARLRLFEADAARRAVRPGDRQGKDSVVSPLSVHLPRPSSANGASSHLQADVSGPSSLDSASQVSRS